MKVKNLYILTLFLMPVLCNWAQNQNLNDILKRGESENQNNEGGVTMIVDTDIYQGNQENQEKTPEEIEQNKQDSIKQINEKWRTYWLKQTEKLQQLDNEIQQKEDNNMTKEIADGYILQINNLKEDFLNKKETNALWKDNDDLDEMRNNFNEMCSKILTELNRQKEKPPTETKPNMLIIIGICLAAMMVMIPIFTQIKSGMMVKKAKKQQEQQAKKQQQEMERQMLLSDENNMITLK